MQRARIMPRTADWRAERAHGAVPGAAGSAAQLVAPPAAARPCTLTVVREPAVLDPHAASTGPDEHTIRVRRAVPANRLRVCRLGGCQRGLEIHAQTADLRPGVRPIRTTATGWR